MALAGGYDCELAEPLDQLTALGSSERQVANVCVRLACWRQQPLATSKQRAPRFERTWSRSHRPGRRTEPGRPRWMRIKAAVVDSQESRGAAWLVCCSV